MRKRRILIGDNPEDFTHEVLGGQGGGKKKEPYGERGRKGFEVRGGKGIRAHKKPCRNGNERQAKSLGKMKRTSPTRFERA